MANDLLVKVWERLDDKFRHKLARIIAFHHPEFDENRRTSFPELEPLLSLMEANRQLFGHTRAAYGKFSPADMRKATEELLWHVAQWFDEIHKKVRIEAHPWLEQFCGAVRDDHSTILSFNWDLVLDELLLKKVGGGGAYGFEPSLEGPLLLKPHGSLNWFDGKEAENIKRFKTILLAKDEAHSTYAFTEFRAPKSKVGRKYIPLIIPPHYMKRFDRPGFRAIWRTCVSKLSSAREVVFLGYSLPPSDFHARFMLRCAFHNQVEGSINDSKPRSPATGRARVIVVNPDRVSAQRIENVTAPHVSFKWNPMTVKEWVEAQEWNRA